MPGPACWMAAPEPTNRPAPMTPAMAIMDRCRGLSDLDRPACSVGAVPLGASERIVRSPWWVYVVKFHGVARRGCAALNGGQHYTDRSVRPKSAAGPGPGRPRPGSRIGG